MKLSTCLSGLLAMASAATAAQLTQVNNFGSNPSGAKMYIYVPDKLAANPPVVVAIHYCSGTASAYYSGTPYARLADKHGFIVIYPESPYSGTCWDVSSAATLTHNGGGNSNSIANMVGWTLGQYKGDASRVFVTGSSSGAMMTNVMAATYPNLFKAASTYAGVPAGCFFTGTTAGWNSSCANGREVHSQEVWAQTARKMYPGYEGARPRMLTIHGSADAIINAQVSYVVLGVGLVKGGFANDMRCRTSTRPSSSGRACWGIPTARRSRHWLGILRRRTPSTCTARI